MQSCRSEKIAEEYNEIEDRMHFRLISLIKMTKAVTRFHNSYDGVFRDKLKSLKTMGPAEKITSEHKAVDVERKLRSKKRRGTSTWK